MTAALSDAATRPEPGARLDEADVRSEPFLYSRREYVETADGSTTVCSLSVSSPVKEFGPDD
jgi:hypothetical protein